MIPVENPDFENLKPLFIKSKNPNEIWMFLLQKAYAKMLGSYENMRHGTTGQAIYNLTGAPYERLDLTPDTMD